MTENLGNDREKRSLEVDRIIEEGIKEVSSAAKEEGIPFELVRKRRHVAMYFRNLQLIHTKLADREWFETPQDSSTDRDKT